MGVVSRPRSGCREDEREGVFQEEFPVLFWSCDSSILVILDIKEPPVAWTAVFKGDLSCSSLSVSSFKRSGEDARLIHDEW